MSIGNSLRPFDVLEARLDELSEACSRVDAVLLATDLVAIGEEALTHWVLARGDVPTSAEKEGFRLLALQRQGSTGEPSFNACRESCRELAYHFNLIVDDPLHPETRKRAALAVLVARHIVYFVSGKMQVAGLGEFCCASKPVRASEGVAPAT